MTNGDFRAGQEFDLSGVKVRIVQGKKSPDDLRLEIRTNGWVPASMVLNFVMADFYAQNEHTLQNARVIGKTCGQTAGARFIHFCKGAQTLGWRIAAAQLKSEREEAQRRRGAR
jgi:hypothetical protein